MTDDPDGQEPVPTDGQEPVTDGYSWADRLIDLAKTALQCATALGVAAIGHGGHLF